jgi:hypothetical protein
MSEFVVSAQCQTQVSEEMYFEPMNLRRVTIAKALVKPIKQQVPVRIVNFSNTPYCIKMPF